MSAPRRLRRGLTCAVLVVGAGCGSDGNSTDGVPRLTAPPVTTESPPLPTVDQSNTEPSQSAESPLSGFVVVLDAGHNGLNFAHLDEINALVGIGIGTKACNTTGTETDDGVAEAAINFAVTGLVRATLEGAGADVVMTRTDNDGWGPCIDERARIGNAAAADAVVSIHADGAAADRRGFHVIYPAVVDRLTDDIADESLRLAVSLRDALSLGPTQQATYVGSEGLDERGDLGGLLLSDVPAVFVEMGNLRNAEDAAILTSPDGQRGIADAIAAGLTAFLLT